ncbi:PREDICTED: neuronal acetylcholine receptor subunit beta-2-like [Branchiostoma belcheri]|uniref:Neuronal acetylcholine receptor subunit beta-2-like n=1 Tax=Branchiostoma belcheri TaxID=7741 RepID=A0A6P5AIV3_BRABE|nr:PREDICTED: neuronal acetylcholine receptor subunit beta-2-like [Branchiostoma belcheri]
MTVRLVTDHGKNRKGFRASYVAEDKVYSNCGVGQYRCANGVTCIDAWKRCDGNNDCRDNSDEDESHCACQDIPPSLGSMCSRGISYQKMTLPNPFNPFGDTSVEAVESSEDFIDLSAIAELDCHPRIRDLVCATILPRCESSPNLRQQLPCRSWCEEVQFACELEAIDVWSAFPSCEMFPHTNCNNINGSMEDGEKCFDGNGANYRGDEATGAATGVKCERWDSDETLVASYPWANLVDNKCRNPGDYERPWCLTPSGFEYCDIIPCNVVGCEDPGKPRFGKRSPIMQFYYPGERVTYTCDVGFKFRPYAPPNNVVCVYNEETGEAEWSSPKPNCVVDHKYKLQKDLLSPGIYRRSVSPTTRLEIKAYVVNVVNLDEKAEKIVTSFKAEFSWKDDRLEWQPKQYGDLEKIFVFDEEVWLPTLTLQRNADVGYIGGFPKTEVKMENTGDVTWPVELLTTTTCTLDPFLFPQDNMTCAVCWRAGEEYIIGRSNATSRRDLNFLNYFNSETDIVTGEWSGKTTLSASLNEACLTITLKRDPTYHYSTTISPCLILIILMVITFIMPIDKGDRIGFGVTLLLAMVVSLVVVTGFLPVSSTLPFIALVIIVCMALMALFMLTTLCIIIIHDKKGPVPKWARAVFLKHMARALMMGDLTKKLKKEEDKDYNMSSNVNGVEVHANQPYKMDDIVGGDNPPSTVDTEVGATLIGLKGSVDELKVSVRQLSGSIDAVANIAAGEDDEEVGEYALLAGVLDRLSLVIYVIAIVVTIPCSLLFGRRLV